MKLEQMILEQYPDTDNKSTHCIYAPNVVIRFLAESFGTLH